MLFTTPTQWIALAITLIAGWLFGLASHPGGRKWKQRYADERDVHGRTRKDLDARLAEREARIAELERDNERLSRAAPVASDTMTTDRHAIGRERMAQSAARPAGSTRARWFNWQNRVGTNG
ncbi:hypothetical protein [Sphingomonas dokdonensis]|uniref:Uncharacterized protein n=1 Tax=Sphingomonas dokdonensis TaxID=344880 RepID=A0A245ZUX8_9SPHN|nr:hypothetical protein [Sphingomonas dokdonensis]OWK33520.1 hypothetical protein SPDO_03990 [Sphingomonas dokdonensis]